MSRLEKGVAIVLFVTFFLYLYGAIRLGIGEPRNPGPGLFPLLTCLALGILLLFLLISWIRGLAGSGSEIHLHSVARLGVIVGLLLFFGISVEKAGFPVSIFLATTLMLRINGIKKWWFLLLFAFLASVGTFLLFNMLLGVRLPLGSLRYF